MPHAEPLASRLSAALMWLSVACALGLSAPTLHALGIPYLLPTGPMPAKIHPSTPLMVAALLLALMARGNPLAALGPALRAQPLVTVYLGCMVYIGLWSVWRHGTGGAAVFVDTLWMPGLALLTMSLHPRRRSLALGRLVAVMLVVNAVMALSEQLRGQTWIPQQVGYDDLLPDDYFRASALFGHPLVNALMTASLLPMVRLLPLPPALGRVPVAVAWVLLLLALLAFGGRTATAASVLMCLGMLGWQLSRLLTSGRLSLAQWLGGAAGGVLALAAVAGTVAATGLGERIFSNMSWDNSANARLVAWQALDHMDLVDWWIGMSPQQVDTIANLIGLDLRYEAIENFWIVMLMQVGLIGFLPFLIGLAAGTAYAWRGADWPMRMGIVLYFIVASGANTLAAKTVSLLLLFIAAQATAAWLREARSDAQQPRRPTGPARRRRAAPRPPRPPFTSPLRVIT